MLQNLFANLPGVTKNLLLLNVVMFVLSIAFPNVGDMLALHYFESTFFEPYQIVSHFFMHASIGHIFFNMFALVMFGAQLEKIWGPQRFLFFYLFSAVGAFLLHMGVKHFEYSAMQEQIDLFTQTYNVDVFNSFLDKHFFPYENYLINNEPDFFNGVLDAQTRLMNGSPYSDTGTIMQSLYNMEINIPMLGASGAIMGLLAAFAFIFPNTELMLIFLPVPIKAKYFVPFYMLVELFLGVGNFQWDNIAHFAHLGGALFGIILVLIWKKDRTKFY